MNNEIKHETISGNTPKLHESILAVCPFSPLTIELECKLKLLYANIPYHNWDKHITETLDAAAELISRCRKFNIEIDEEVIIHAVMGHDVLFHLKHQALNFDNKEILAATYVRDILKDLGATEEHADKVFNAIMATYSGFDPKTPEEIILRAADLKNLGGTFDKFYANTNTLYEESIALNNNQSDFFTFAEKALGYLSHYLIKKLELTPLFYNSDGRSEWHENAISNMIELYSRCHGGRDNVKIILQYPAGDKPADISERILSEKVMLIGVDECDSARADFINSAKTLIIPEGGRIVTYALPAVNEKLPLPDKSCDVIYLAASSSISGEEITRVLKNGGQVRHTR